MQTSTTAFPHVLPLQKLTTVSVKSFRFLFFKKNVRVFIFANLNMAHLSKMCTKTGQPQLSLRKMDNYNQITEQNIDIR